MELSFLILMIILIIIQAIRDFVDSEHNREFGLLRISIVIYSREQKIKTKWKK